MEALKHSSSVPVNPANSGGKSPVYSQFLWCKYSPQQISSYQWFNNQLKDSSIFNNWLLWAGSHDDYITMSLYFVLLSYIKDRKSLLCLHLQLNTPLFINLNVYPFISCRRKKNLCLFLKLALPDHPSFPKSLLLLYFQFLPLHGSFKHKLLKKFISVDIEADVINRNLEI